MALTEIDPARVRELQVIRHGPLVRIIVFLLLHALGAAAAVTIAGWLGGGWLAVCAVVPFHVLAGASLHGISLFTHEGVHGVLSQTSFWNRALAMACALPVLQNFSAYRVLHLKHHGDTGGAHDPDHYANYTHRNRPLFIMHWARLLVGYPVYLVAIPWLGFQQGNRVDRLWIGVELSILAVVVTAVAISQIPATWILHGWLLPMVAINTMVNIRGMSQHTLLEEPIHSIRGTRTILARPLVAFFMCNENFHLEHHLYPRVPWYNLPRLHHDLHAALEAERAPFIPSYFAFVREFARKSRGLWNGDPSAVAPEP